jgi:hypothetical protein
MQWVRSSRQPSLLRAMIGPPLRAAPRSRVRGRASVRVARLGALLALLLLVGPAVRGRAQEPGDREQSSGDEFASDELASSVYRAHITAALREYRAHRFFEARSLFAKAHEVFPNARTLRGLAMVEFELRNYVDSAALFERALAEPVRPITGSLRRDTEQLRERAEGFVAHYEIESERPLIITVDSVRVEGPGSSIALGVGDHVLELSALGYATERRLVRVRGGERERLTIKLQPLDREPRPPKKRPVELLAHEPPAVPEREHQPGTPPMYKNKWLWTGVGVATAALAVGLGFGLTAHDGRTEDPISARPVAIRSGP